MVANHNIYGARSAIREVAKVSGLTSQPLCLLISISINILCVFHVAVILGFC